MRLRSRLAPANIIPMAAMADIAFLLIIFFMLTSTFAKDTGLDIALPKALASESLPKREVTIWVNRFGQVKVDERWINPEELYTVLEQKLAQAGVKGVTIRGDERVPYGTVVTIMDAAKSLGADITLAAEVEVRGVGSGSR